MSTWERRWLILFDIHMLMIALFILKCSNRLSYKAASVTAAVHIVTSCLYVCNRCALETWGVTLQVMNSPGLLLLTWLPKNSCLQICQLLRPPRTFFLIYLLLNWLYTHSIFKQQLTDSFSTCKMRLALQCYSQICGKIFKVFMSGHEPTLKTMYTFILFMNLNFIFS